MAGYYYSYDSSSVTITVSGISSGDECRFFCRLSSSSKAEETTKTATGRYCEHTFTGLRPSTPYVINVYVNGEETNQGNSSFTTDAEVIEYPFVTMTIRITNAVSKLQLRYVNPDGTRSTSYARDGDTFDVKPGSTQTILSIDLDGYSDYGNPILCQGSSTPFQVTDENGAPMDSSLSMGNSNKTFTFYGTSKNKSVTLNVCVSSGLSYVRIEYVAPGDDNTSKSYQDVYANGGQSYGIQIKDGTDAEVVGFEFSGTDYGHPISATGASTFNVTTDLGDWNDPVLGNISDGKTFTIKATYGGYNDANSGYVYICTDARNNIWMKATPYICDKLYADGTAHWVKATPYVKTGSSSTSWTIAGH